MNESMQSTLLAHKRMTLAGLVAMLQMCAGCGTPSSTTDERAPVRATAAPGADKSAGVVAVEQLPDRERALLAAWRSGGAAWELERERMHDDPALARFLVDNLVRDMVRAYDRSALAKTGQAPGAFERARDELVLLHAHSTPVLIEMLTLQDGVLAFLASDVLVKIGEPVLAPLARKLDDPKPEIRRRACELAGRLPHAGGGETAWQERLAALAEKDPEWIVRAQAARALGARASLHSHKGYALGVLVRVARERDEVVAESAATALGELGEERGAERLVDLLEHAAANGRPGVVRALDRSLQRLTHTQRTRDVAGWRAHLKQREAEQKASEQKASEQRASSSGARAG